MSNYRKAFYLALIGNIVFIGVLGVVWWNSRKAVGMQGSTASSTGGIAEPIGGSQPNEALAPKETPLAPVQLSAERLQSIGVKFGVVERRPVQDEIRATGNVAV